MSIENVRKWFMIHTYSGYEKKVKTDLEQKVGTLQLRDVVTNILVPEEETTEIVRGKPKKIYRKLFPAYVMLEMEATREENENGILLEGIISRKKQLIPTLMNAMAEKV